MIGHVDESLRALLDVSVGNQAADQSAVIRVWVDTAFDGFFVFPRAMIEELGLRQEAMNPLPSRSGYFLGSRPTIWR